MMRRAVVWAALSGVGRFCLPADVSGLIRDAAGIHAMPPFAITLLKGDLWQGNAGLGVIHRSPLVPEAEVPCVDAVWD